MARHVSSTLSDTLAHTLSSALYQHFSLSAHLTPQNPPWHNSHSHHSSSFKTLKNVGETVNVKTGINREEKHSSQLNCLLIPAKQLLFGHS